MGSDVIRVILADDHAVVRAGFGRLLEEAKNIVVVAESESGEKACHDYFKHKPDVAIMDLSMPGIGGLAAIQRILAKDKNARILALSVHEDIEFPTRVLQAGARGYVSKRCVPKILIEAVQAVANGEIFLEREIAQQIAMDGTTNGNKNPVSALTEREFEVFCHLAEGWPVKKIAESLFISPKTVATYQTRIMHKLNVPNIATLARLAIRKGFVNV
jgi:two-component system invasion response regulator UvrY